MKKNKCLLNTSSVTIVPGLTVRIPTVGEILEDEAAYYGIVSALTATPFQYMVQLDDLGIDYTSITDYELFKMLFPVYAGSDLSILFGDLYVSDFALYQDENAKEIIYSPASRIEINENVYNDLADMIRKINLLEKVKSKPGMQQRGNIFWKKNAKSKNGTPGKNRNLIWKNW